MSLAPDQRLRRSALYRELVALDATFAEDAHAPNLMIGTVVSGDRFVEDTATLRWLQREFGALATEMEGAAVGYTCQLNGLPFVVVRGLSDTANESASQDFEANLEIDCRHSFRLMRRLIPDAGRESAVGPPGNRQRAAATGREPGCAGAR